MTALKNYQMYIDGQWVDAEGGDSFTSFNPATGEEWARIPAATAADVDRAVNAGASSVHVRSLVNNVADRTGRTTPQPR